ncbi:MAG TPA: hypothetical protein VG844_13805 [Terracidiphilus sp.]|nr:hypothetical protein [Terracidiphilus sp.]
MMSLVNALWLLGIAAETALIGVLTYRRAWKAFPTFYLLVISDFAFGIANFFIRTYFADFYLPAYLVEISVSSVLEFCVLVELAWSVLKPIRGSLSKWTLLYIAGIILLAGALIWPFSGLEADTGTQERLLVHLVQTVGFLRVGFFLLLAATSQWLSIGWRDRELQIATGLGFYSLVSLIVAMLRTHYGNVEQYASLNNYVVASYVFSLVYWGVSFAQKEAERREFTPQMQNVLLAVASAARASRSALNDQRQTPSPGSR